MNYEIPRKWENAVNCGDLEKILECYNDQASLLATFQPEPILTTKGIREYFLSFISKKEAGVSINEKSLHFFVSHESGYVVCGLYEFFFLEDEKLVRHPARFTFVVDVDEIDKIKHHHSSLIPSFK